MGPPVNGRFVRTLSRVPGEWKYPRTSAPNTRAAPDWRALIQHPASGSVDISALDGADEKPLFGAPENRAPHSRIVLIRARCFSAILSLADDSCNSSGIAPDKFGGAFWQWLRRASGGRSAAVGDPVMPPAALRPTGLAGRAATRSEPCDAAEQLRLCGVFHPPAPADRSGPARRLDAARIAHAGGVAHAGRVAHPVGPGDGVDPRACGLSPGPGLSSSIFLVRRLGPSRCISPMCGRGARRRFRPAWGYRPACRDGSVG
ncbi:hypothetical protein BJ973_004528 [Actinoplanes tereljensis]